MIIINHHHHSSNKGFNMIIQIQWEFDLEDNSIEAHNEFAAENGVPTEVDLNDYLKDPASASDDQITDALSDEHGWLIYNWSL